MTVFQQDRALLDAFRAGNPEALTRVYWHYVDDVSLVIRRGFVVEGSARVAGVQDAELQRELLQEVFTRALGERARAAYDGLRPYRPYLLRVAKNLLIDRARQSGREQFLEDLGVGDIDTIIEGNLAVEAGPSLEERTDQQRLVAATREYVAGLDEELRTFVHLRFEGERSQDAVASHMGITRRRTRTLEAQLAAALDPRRARSSIQAHRGMDGLTSWVICGTAAATTLSVVPTTPLPTAGQLLPPPLRRRRRTR